MGLFGGGNSKKTTTNIDNRTVYDMSGSTFDNRVDNSTNDNSYTDNSAHLNLSADDNSYSDSSFNYADDSYSDSSSFVDDNSFTDTSTNISGQYAGNSGSINITDGGAFTTVQNAVSDLVGMGNRSFMMSEFALSTMGKTADLSMEKNQLNVEIMRDVTTKALEQMSTQATNTVSASTQANREALASSNKLMTTISANGNDLLIDGVVDIAKYIGYGIGGLALAYVGVSAIKGLKK